MMNACHESKPESNDPSSNDPSSNGPSTNGPSSNGPPLKIIIPPHETEVFRVIPFSKDKAYEVGLYTKQKGLFPYVKYYANTDSLKYVGYWVRSERWGGECGDGRGGAEIFIDNGKTNRIVYDYDGKTCFVEALLIPRGSDHVQKGTLEGTPL